MTAPDSFQAKLTAARSALESARFAQAHALLREARQMSGREREPALLEMWATLGKQCERAQLHTGWHVRTLDGHSGWVSAAQLSADARWAVSGGEDKAVRLWEVATGKCVRTFEGHRDWVLSVSLDASGRRAVSGSSDRTLRLWDVPAGSCVRTIEGHKDQVLSVSLGADGRWGLSGSSDRTIRLWDLPTGRCLRTFEGHTGAVTTVGLSPDGRWAVSGGDDGHVHLWNVATGEGLRVLEGHKGWVSAAATSADGRWAVSGGDDKHVRLWDLGTGKCMRSFQGHTDWVLTVCLSPDGRWALSGGRDRTVRLWEVATGKNLWTLEGHAESVTTACLSADGRWALSGGGDQTLRVWELHWELRPHEPADWDEGARPHLERFLTYRTPYAAEIPAGERYTRKAVVQEGFGLRQPRAEVSEEERYPEEALRRALTRHGKPSWTGEDFQEFLGTLGHCGYGWLRPEGVQRHLEKLAADWLWPPPFPAEVSPDRRAVSCPNASCRARLYFPSSLVAMQRECLYCQTKIIVYPSPR